MISELQYYSLQEESEITRANMVASTEEEQLMERLRAKYSRLGQEDAPGNKAADQERLHRVHDTASAGASSSVQLCTVCQGNGRVQEVYNHRVLEVSRSCDE